MYKKNLFFFWETEKSNLIYNIYIYEFRRHINGLEKLSSIVNVINQLTYAWINKQNNNPKQQ